MIDSKSPRRGERDLVISGIGMVTSVGPDAVTSCASVRAGLSRATELSNFSLLDLETCDLVALRGHPVVDYTEGFCLVGAWLRLALGSVLDLLSRANLPDRGDRAFWNRTGLMVIAPELHGDRFGNGADDREALAASYLPRLCDGARIAPRADVCSLAGAAGHAGALAAALAARDAIGSSSVDRVIIASADSYLDDMSLAWLAEASRLKTPENPVGLAPGEAGACLLLEDGAAARRRGGAALARLDIVRTDQEPSAFARGEHNQGQALGRALREVLNAAHGSAPARFSGDWIADLNGETWRANEFGGAQARVADLLGDVRAQFPAACVGDTGAASGALNLGFAARALERRYASGDRVLVTASSAGGSVAAAMLSAPRGD